MNDESGEQPAFSKKVKSPKNMNQPPAHNPEERNDQALDDFLRKAKAEVPLPDAFQADVWRRIAVRHQSTVSVRLGCWMEKIFGSLVGPVPAAATLLFMISAGIWFGSKGTESGDDGKSAYVRSVSPFAADHQGGTR